MYKISLRYYVRLGRFFQELLDSLYIDENAKVKFDKDEEEEKAHMNRVLELMALPSKRFGLTFQHQALMRAMNNHPQTMREVQMLIDQFDDGISGITALAIPINRAEEYERDHLSATSGERFPTAVMELREAGNCFALGRFTASVFHSMRAAEVGIHALADTLSISFPAPLDQQQWGNILEKIEAEVAKRKTQPKTPDKADELKFFAEIAIQFGYLKDAWRNSVSHQRTTYDEVKARSILQHTRELFEQLASRLREPDNAQTGSQI